MPGLDKRAVWGDRLRRFQRSRLTVAGFCDQEGVSVPSFYQWRRRLTQPPVGPPRQQLIAKRRKPATPATPQQATPAFQQVTLAGLGGVVAIEWSSGVRMELPAENLPVVRAVVAELLQAEHTRSVGGAGC